MIKCSVIIAGPTKRWTPMRYHPEQHRLVTSPARFKMNRAGRRSGKTEIFKRRICNQVKEDFINPKPWDDTKYFCAAPVRAQAKKIYWEDLKALIPKAWMARKPLETELIIQMKWGAEIHVVGLDQPARIEGTPWDGGGIDELANCKPGIFDANIRPMLADRKGWCWMFGVPDRDAPGQRDYKKKWDAASAGLLPGWDTFWWSSRDILDADEIQSMADTMDPELFDQEIEGAFKLGGGLAFPSFDPTVHVRPCVYDPSLPLCLMCDFNVDPMCWGIGQHKNGFIQILYEIILHDSHTPAACDALEHVCEQKGWSLRNVTIYGDATGAARDTTSPGDSDWSLIEDALKNYGHIFNVPSGSPRIKDTLNALRGVLKTASGKVGIAIDPQCKVLVEDLQTLVWPSDMSDGHCVAWLRYFCQWEYPQLIAIDQPMGTVGVMPIVEGY